MPRGSVNNQGSVENWHYKAVDPEGRMVHGEIAGTDEADVTQRLRRQKLLVVEVVPASRGGTLRVLLMAVSGRRHALRLRPAEVADFTRKLATMLTAGLDMDRALRFLAETAVGSANIRVIRTLRDRVRDGESFATALESMPAIFPRLYVGMVRAGEAGGALGDALVHLSDLLERERKLRASVQSALIYPAVLVVASIGSVVLLLTQVLPQFVPLFEENGATLPLATRIVIAAGAFLTAWGLPLLVVFVLSGVGLYRVLQRPDRRLKFDRALLRLPVVGTLLVEIMAAQFTRALGTLMRNGVPIVGALRIAEGVIGNRAGAACVAEATQDMREGRGLATSLARAGVFPETMIQFLRVGEETAQLATISLRSADIHEDTSRVIIQRLLAILVPAITIVMGVIVAGIVSALLLAMLSLNDLAH